MRCSAPYARPRDPREAERGSSCNSSRRRARPPVGGERFAYAGATALPGGIPGRVGRRSARVARGREEISS